MVRSLSVIVPAFNEESRLGSTLERLATYLGPSAWKAEIIVVDDGSRDGTAALARAIAKTAPVPIVVEVLEANRGKGAAVRRGVLVATHDLVLFSDADLSTPIEEVEHLLAALDQGYDIAIGSRATAGARIERRQVFYREIMGKTFNRMVRLLAGLNIADTQCGFKLFRRQDAVALFRALRTEGFGFDVEILHRATRLGLRIKEVPVIWRNSPNSTVHPVRDAARMAYDLVKMRWRARRQA